MFWIYQSWVITLFFPQLTGKEFVHHFCWWLLPISTEVFDQRFSAYIGMLPNLYGVKTYLLQNAIVMDADKLINLALQNMLYRERFITSTPLWGIIPTPFFMRVKVNNVTALHMGWSYRGVLGALSDMHHRPPLRCDASGVLEQVRHVPWRCYNTSHSLLCLY